jgi:hypothetical protein
LGKPKKEPKRKAYPRASKATNSRSASGNAYSKRPLGKTQATAAQDLWQLRRIAPVLGKRLKQVLGRDLTAADNSRGHLPPANAQGIVHLKTPLNVL